MRGANVLSVALLGQAVAWGAAAGGEGLLVVADEQQLRVSRISEAPATDGGLGVRAVASRRTGVPIESVSICRWNARPHVVLVVSRPEGSTVRIYRVQNGAVAAAFADLRIEYPTRKAQIADVDGDSLAELVVSVSKKTRRDPTVRLRPFVYQWSGVSWVPKWLGSRLGYDLVDFTCVPAAGGDRLLTLERTPSGEAVVTPYGWIGFGFRGTAEPAPAFAERIGGAPEMTWVWDRQGRVDWLEVGAAGTKEWLSAETGRPLQAVFPSHGHLCGFDGEAVVPIGKSTTGGDRDAQ